MPWQCQNSINEAKNSRRAKALSIQNTGHSKQQKVYEKQTNNTYLDKLLNQ